MSAQIVIVGAARTPLGSFGGSLSPVSCTQLGASAIEGALSSCSQAISADAIQEVIMGNVLSAGLGQAPARQACLGAGLNTSTCCTTVNKVCSSGLKAVAYGAQSIKLGDATCVVAGGMENMSRVSFHTTIFPSFLSLSLSLSLSFSWFEKRFEASGLTKRSNSLFLTGLVATSQVPYYLPMNRGQPGYRMGDKQVWDGMIKDGLWDPYDDVHMGVCGEKCAKEFGITRKEQDDFAIESLRRAHRAHQKGYFKDEIVPVEVKKGRGNSVIVSDDEPLVSLQINESKIRGLKPAFQKDHGTITAANASTISDGAAAVVLMGEETSRALKLKPLARIVGWADSEQDPVKFPTTPAKAIEKLMRKTGRSLQEVDAVEINEAFAAVVLANMKLLGIPHEKVNQHGGGCGLGHPIGCSGARILVTLINVLEKTGGKLGVAAICNGGGGATAMLIETII